MKKNNRRQSDHWTQKAKKAGFQARSVYKLEEIDKKFGIVKGKKRALDLGCCPGSWSQYIARRVPKCQILGVDIQPTPSFPGEFIECSIEDLSLSEVVDTLGGQPDLVLSDMAPSTIGQRFTDHLRQIALAELALQAANKLLLPGGTFVVKVFDGQDAPAFVSSMRESFAKVKRFKPKATRGVSVEFFLIGMDKR